MPGFLVSFISGGKFFLPGIFFFKQTFGTKFFFNIEPIQFFLSHIHLPLFVMSDLLVTLHLFDILQYLVCHYF